MLELTDVQTGFLGLILMIVLLLSGLQCRCGSPYRGSSGPIHATGYLSSTRFLKFSSV